MITERLGGSVSLTRPLTDYVKISSRYRLEKVDVKNIDDDATDYIKAQKGSNLTSAFSFSLSKNTIDDIMNPTKGMNADITAEFAGGPLSGDNNFYSFVGILRKIFPHEIPGKRLLCQGYCRHDPVLRRERSADLRKILCRWS